MSAHPRSPFGPFQLGAAGSLEAALTDIMHVVELLSVLATAEQDIAARSLYPAADQLRRRHLTESQRAMVAAKIANLGDGRPKINRANLHGLLPAPHGADRPRAATHPR